LRATHYESGGLPVPVEWRSRPPLHVLISPFQALTFISGFRGVAQLQADLAVLTGSQHRSSSSACFSIAPPQSQHGGSTTSINGTPTSSDCHPCTASAAVYQFRQTPLRILILPIWHPHDVRTSDGRRCH
jgi:hypothetical protein